MRVKFGFLWLFCGAFAVLGGVCAYASMAPNPRTSESDSVSRAGATTVQSRVVSENPGNRSLRGAITTRAASGGNSVRTRVATTTGARGGTTNARTATRTTAPLAVSRVARALKLNTARSGKNTEISPIGGMARSGVARATAVFSDVGKIGSGYAECRESYATCMDQMCAVANDSYRRGFCSDRFT